MYKKYTKILLLGDAMIGKTKSIVDFFGGAYLPIPYNGGYSHIYVDDKCYKYIQTDAISEFVYNDFLIHDFPSSLKYSELLKEYVESCDYIVIYTNNERKGLKEWMSTAMKYCSIYSDNNARSNGRNKKNYFMCVYNVDEFDNFFDCFKEPNF